eukprot:3066925-Amphidinium_carterae.3
MSTLSCPRYAARIEPLRNVVVCSPFSNRPISRVSASGVESFSFDFQQSRPQWPKISLSAS